MAWKNRFNVLQEDRSCKIISAMVLSFNGAKYVSLGEKPTIEQMNGIGDVLREEIIYHGAGDVTVQGRSQHSL